MSHRWKTFRCRICDNKFTTFDNLNLHKRQSHTGEKLFKCPFCEKTFITPSNLSVHKRSHTGEQPFNCNFCQKRFTQSKFDFSHTGSLGRGTIQMYFLWKAFDQVSTLTLHKWSHTGENPFTCRCCQKAFSDW